MAAQTAGDLAREYAGSLANLIEGFARNDVSRMKPDESALFFGLVVGLLGDLEPAVVKLNELKSRLEGCGCKAEPTVAPVNLTKKKFKLEGMNTSSCMQQMQELADKLPGALVVYSEFEPSGLLDAGQGDSGTIVIECPEGDMSLFEAIADADSKNPFID